MTITLKKTVNPNITPDFAMGLGWLARDWEVSDMGPFVITSLKDSGHQANSDHKHDQPETVPGEAGDIRTWKHFVWTDEESEAYYIKNWKLPEGKVWKDMGCHTEKMKTYAQRLRKEGFKVHLHPDDDKPGANVVPHLHVGKPHGGFFLLV